jgi:uncharacterized protein (TIGR02001 family)
VRNVLKAVVCAGVLASPAAMAGVSGNAGVVSEYLFRGIEQSGGAAVQGGIDWSTGPGIYLGTWASNTGGPAASGGTEVDLYGGWAGKAGPVGLDFGAIYYLYNEDEEDLFFGPGVPTALDYWEVYAKLSVSYFALQAYYTTDYLGDANAYFADSIGKDTSFMYVNLLANFPLTETLTLGLQVGNSSGEGAEVAWDATAEDGYTDYSVSLTKTLDAGLAFSFGLYNTTLEAGDGFGTVPFDDDGIKAVVGLKKTFDL